MSQTNNAASAPGIHPLDTALVLKQRPLRPGAVLEHTSRFGDDQWHLRPALLQQHQRALVLNFNSIPHRYRMVVKEVCYTMLSGDLPDGEPRPEVATVRAHFTSLKLMLTWLDSRTPPPGRPSGPRLADLIGADLQDFQRHLLATVPSSARRQGIRSAVRYFWRYRACLTSDQLSFDPLHVQDWTEPDRRSSGGRENTTDRIPEAVHGPLLAWSLRFINDFAPDILRADNEWRRCRDHHDTTRAGRNVVKHRLDDLLADYIRNQRPLPSWNGQPNMAHLADEIGGHHSALLNYHAEIAAAAAIVGLAPDTCYRIGITGLLDDKPWIHGISVHPGDNNGLGKLTRMLMAACYGTIAFLSGMRDSEIKHLRRGCLTVERDDQGRVLRWKATSLAFKGEHEAQGVEATWVIGQPAARAIQILERLHPPDTMLLFSALSHHPGGNSSTAAAGTRALSTVTTNRYLNGLIGWINDYCDTHGRSDRIPMVNGQPWRLTSRQYRRTLAWYVARRPGGV
ncbi:hypothetical protein [Nocardia pseudovaccinii]|uniref:hypothetical protein n=1 Tax=Nocardia pseudovaccinii TaxID=189540 RepID=UPI000B2D00C7|nr:hypothetical protein [Nocardia pseudovaccinii]